MMGLIFWLCSLIYGLCIVGGGFAFVLLCWFAFTKHGRAAALRLLDVPEYRCSGCRDADNCPAFDSGVAYPCDHYKKSEDKPA